MRNTYREPADLFVSGVKDEILKSKEGTTQGDNLAMSFYACAVTKLIQDLRISSPDSKTVWFADDSASAGSVDSVLKWWNDLKKLGPKYGYYPKPNKTWLIVKPSFHQYARQKFEDINITTDGHRYLGSFIGTDSGKENFVKGLVAKWKEDITALSSIAKSEPQVAYAAYVYGLSHKWTFLMRTTPGTSGLLQEIEEQIKNELIPALCDNQISIMNREIMSLPVRYGGMAIDNPVQIADKEYEYSLKVTEQVWQAIISQDMELHINEDDIRNRILYVQKEKKSNFEQKLTLITSELSEEKKRQLLLLREKGTSAWLTALPLIEHSFVLNKQEFHDGIALRYGLSLQNCPRICVCGTDNTNDHMLICKRGGFVSLRHNTIRDTTAEILRDVCKDVNVEPRLIPMSGETLPTSANTSQEARLDISARGVWAPLDKAFFDIRVIHPNAASNVSKSIDAMYRTHEMEKKRLYNERILQVEKATFTPLVLTTTGGMSIECKRFYKRIAQLLANKNGQSYSDMISWIRKRISFEILKTCVIAVRGFRGPKYKNKMMTFSEMDFNLVD